MPAVFSVIYIISISSISVNWLSCPARSSISIVGYTKVGGGRDVALSSVLGSLFFGLYAFSLGESYFGPWAACGCLQVASCGYLRKSPPL